MSFYFNSTIIKCLRNRKTKLLMVGLSDSGKTTIIKSFRFDDECIKEENMYFFNWKTYEYNNFSMKIFNIGSGSDCFSFYRSFFSETDGVIFVVDSSDVSRIDEVRDYLFRFDDDRALKNSVFLIFANKQDLKNSMNSEKLQQKLEIKKIKHEYKIVECCAYMKEDLYNGLQWICETIKNKDPS